MTMTTAFCFFKMILTFGKHCGETLERVMRTDWPYFKWLTQLAPVVAVDDDGSRRLVLRDTHAMNIDCFRDNAAFHRDNLPPHATDALRSTEWWEALEATADPIAFCEPFLDDLDLMHRWSQMREPFFLRRLHRDAILASRAALTEARACWECGGRLVPVGTEDRAHGRPQDAVWDWRTLHEECLLMCASGAASRDSTVCKNGKLMKRNVVKCVSYWAIRRRPRGP